jgi:hypothetical protein
MPDEDAPEYGDIVNFPDGPTDGAGDEDRRWVVLYPDDYDKHANDMDGNVGVLVDEEQAHELHRLSVETMLTLGHPDGGEEAIRGMIETLEEVLNE